VRAIVGSSLHAGFFVLCYCIDFADGVVVVAVVKTNRACETIRVG
jgi:hypothetical protein